MSKCIHAIFIAIGFCILISFGLGFVVGWVESDPDIAWVAPHLGYPGEVGRKLGKFVFDPNGEW